MVRQNQSLRDLLRFFVRYTEILDMQNIERAASFLQQRSATSYAAIRAIAANATVSGGVFHCANFSRTISNT